MQTFNPNFIKLLREILAFIAFVLMVSMFFCCCISPAKKLQNAKQLVLTDSATFRSVGVKFVELNPCSNEIHFKSDTVYLHDTTMHFEHYTDSIHHTDTVRQYITITNTIKVHDTATVIDGQKVKLLEQSNQQKELQIAAINQQIIDAHNATIAVQKEEAKWKWLFWGLLILLLGFSAFKLIKAFTPSGSIVSTAEKLIK